MASLVAPNSQLKDGERTTSGGKRRHRVRGLFVLLQVSLSVVVLVGTFVVWTGSRRMREPLPNTEPNQALTPKASNQLLETMVNTPSTVALRP